MLEGGDVKKEEIAVISMYLPHLDEVKKQMGIAKIYVGTCLTIDAARGDEYQIVIISLVRCNGTGQIGFLDDLRRQKIGITRAKKSLLLNGSKCTLLLRDYHSV